MCALWFHKLTSVIHCQLSINITWPQHWHAEKVDKLEAGQWKSAADNLVVVEEGGGEVCARHLSYKHIHVHIALMIIGSVIKVLVAGVCTGGGRAAVRPERTIHPVQRQRLL